MARAINLDPNLVEITGPTEVIFRPRSITYIKPGLNSTVAVEPPDPIKEDTELVLSIDTDDQRRRLARRR